MKKTLTVYVSPLEMDSVAHRLVELPMEQGKLAALLLELNTGSPLYTEVSDFCGREYLEEHLPEDMDLTELNLLAEKLASLEPVQEAAFEGLVRMDLDKGTMELPLCRLIDLANSADCCHVAPGVENDEQLGHFYVDNDFPVIPPGLPEEVYEVLDYAAIGHWPKGQNGGGRSLHLRRLCGTAHRPGCELLAVPLWAADGGDESMKHRLAPLLEGMEMGKSEHDWLEQRLESMTAKEELLFRGAMQIESPRDIQTTIKILQGLDHYQLLYGAEDDVLLGRFVMEHIHTPTHAARGYLDPEIVGAAYREHGSGSFVENHYVERLNPDRPLPEVNPNVPLSITGEYAIRVKLVSRNNMEGVWIGFPDTGEYMDTAHPDELLLGLDALQAETLDQCMAVDVDCVLPQITDILNQYDSAGELVRHAIDFGYVWAEQGQGEPHWMEKWQCVMELEDCHRLDLALDLAQNLHCYEFIPRGVDLAQYGMDLARKEGVLGQDPLLIQCFDSVAYAQHHMAKYGLSATDHGYAARNEQEIIYEYSQPEHEPEMTM